jgi:class 3 adenylate cyclase
VTNLSARLSGMARAGQILVTQRVVTGAAEVAVTSSLGPMELRGITRPVEVFDVLGLDAARTAP